MKSRITWISDKTFTGQTESGHSIVIGTAEENSPKPGPSAMELVLMGLGGCASYDVVAILAKARQNVTNCVTHVTASRVDEIPQVFDKIHMEFEVTGHDLDEKKVARAVSLSADKYCSASRMLDKY